jgi:hypothetical protein
VAYELELAGTRDETDNQRRSPEMREVVGLIGWMLCPKGLKPAFIFAQIPNHTPRYQASECLSRYKNEVQIGFLGSAKNETTIASLARPRVDSLISRSWTPQCREN